MRQGCQQHVDQDSCETDVLEYMKVQNKSISDLLGLKNGSEFAFEPIYNSLNLI